MVDLKKEIEKIRKELEKLENKQDKVNYLQELYKKIKEKELKDLILHLLDELLEKESLEEVVEPVKVRHDILEDIRRETPIIQPINITSSITLNQRSSNGDDENKEEVLYQRKASSNTERTLYMSHGAKIAENLETLRRDIQTRKTSDIIRYVTPINMLPEVPNIRSSREDIDAYTSPPRLEPKEINKEINQFSIENLFKKKEDKKYLRAKDEKVEW